MQINIVPHATGCNHRILSYAAGKMAQSLVSLGVDDGALFNPADLVFLRLHLQKATSVFENFERLPVHHFPDAV